MQILMWVFYSGDSYGAEKGPPDSNTENIPDTGTVPCSLGLLTVDMLFMVLLVHHTLQEYL